MDPFDVADVVPFLDDEIYILASLHRRMPRSRDDDSTINDGAIVVDVRIPLNLVMGNPAWTGDFR